MFQDDEEVDGWGAGIPVSYSKDCELTLKASIGALLQEAVSVLYAPVFHFLTLIVYLRQFKTDKKNFPHVTHGKCALVATDQNKRMLAAGN